MDKDIKQLREKLVRYQHLQEKWNQQKQFYIKNINLMQQQISRYKAINSNLLKKAKHKRTSSQQQTFIFNQTNISSYYPIMMMKNNNWVTKATLRSHLDSVRAISWQGKYLISAGQDSLLKIWQRDKLLITVREHLAAIYSICGNQNLLFTGGAEGVIRKWQTNSFLHRKGPQAEEEFHEDCIWQLIWNNNNEILISSSSDSTCKVIKVNEKQLTQINCIKIQGDIPTSIQWINDSSFITGLVKNNRLWAFDLQTNKKSMEFVFQSRQNIGQVNKIVQQPKQKLLAAGHQDRIIRFFDPNSNKPIKSLVAHSDAVSSLCFRPIQTNQLISCSHDGTLRIWDIRQYRCTNDVALHMRKYDQSVMCLAHNKEQPGIAVGGADGLLKLLYPEN